jgi:glucokinase
LQIFRVPADATAVPGQPPSGELVFSKKYLNSGYASFEEVCKTFLGELKTIAGGELPATCCLACAGGITNNSVSFTNVSKGWTIDGYALEKALKIPKVKLINDFEAQGYGLLTLTDDEKICLNDAKPRAGAPIACVGAGTGLGECFLTADASGRYTCFPSEGGHVEFSPRDELTDDLFHFLKKKFQLKKRVSVERVVSGPGIAHIYEFLRQHWAYEERVGKMLDQDYNRAPDHMKGAVVAQGALQGDVLCLKVVDIFCECYGSEAGNAALKWLPYGGLYISGGIGAKNPDWVKGEHFMHAYADKGRLSYCVAQVPLYLVTTEDTGERGALFVAVSLLSS